MDNDIAVKYFECIDNNNCIALIKSIPKLEENNINYPLFFLANAYGVGMKEKNIKKNITKSICLLTKLFDECKVIECGLALSYIYMTEKKYCNYQKALDIYINLEITNHHIVLTALGNFYRLGLGNVEVNLNKAEKYYKRAIIEGNLTAAKRLAGLYRQQSKYFKSLQTLFNKKHIKKCYKEYKSKSKKLFIEY